MLFIMTQPYHLKAAMMKRLRQPFDCDHELFVTARRRLCFGGQTLIADLRVSPCPFLDTGEWQVTLNCVVLLRWHANDKDWERPLTVYSPNQSKLCDEKAKRLIRTPGSGCMWQGLQKSSRLVIQTLQSRMGINSNCHDWGLPGFLLSLSFK